MSWDELRTRGAQEIAKRVDTARYRLGLRFPPACLAQRPSAQARFFFAADELPAIVALARRRAPADAERIVERAEQICQHHFDLLGYEGLDYGSKIDWHLDAVNGKSAATDKPWHRVRFLDFEEVGDSKVIWELNRHQHLVTLARAYCFTGEERFTAEVFRQWYHWQEENPYPAGINWASSLEVGFRSLSWLWVRHLLADCPLTTREFPSQLLQALALNGRHIERYLSTYFSPNTHLLGELVGLFFIGVLCPELAAAPRWQRRGWQGILQEARRQVWEDGMHFEQSTYYHVYALDFFLHARILAAANDLDVPPEFDRTLERMLDALCALGQCGSPPRFGDDDGGRVFDPQRNRAEHLLDPLAAGAVLFRRGDWKAVAGDIQEETLWLLGPRAADEFDALPTVPAAQKPRALEASGTYVLESSEPVPRQLVMRAGPMGAHSAGHSHADALSLQLSLGGAECLTDPGTFVYVGAGAERNLFRGTAGHCALQIDGLPQAEPGGPFAWRSRCDAHVEQWISGETFALLSASHAGYRRLEQPVVHRRCVLWVRSSFWLVRDIVEGLGTHQLELFWHLAPGWVAEESPCATLVSKDEGAALVMLMPEGFSWETRQGWWSPAYGRKERSTILCCSTKSRVPVELATLFVPMAKANVPRGTLTRSSERQADAGVQLYRYETAEFTHWMFFAGQAGRWQSGRFASDARVLYGRCSPQSSPSHVLFCDGSFAEIDGQRLLATAERVERCEWLTQDGQAQVFVSAGGAVSRLPGQGTAKDGEVTAPAQGSGRGAT